MKTLKALALGTVPVVGVFLCLLLMQVSAAVQRGSSDLSNVAGGLVTSTAALNGAILQVDSAVANVPKTLNAATKTLDGATAVLATVNRPCKPASGLPCGTLADVADTLHTVRGTFGQIEVAARHEDRNLGTMDAQELQLFNDTHATLSSANALIASPYIAESLKNIDVSTAAIADSAKQADVVIGDVRFEADKLAHPPKKKLGFWGATVAAGDWLRHFMPPLF